MLKNLKKLTPSKKTVVVAARLALPIAAVVLADVALKKMGNKTDTEN